LRAQFEEIRSAGRKPIPVDSLDELLRAIIEARIAAGLSQKELAERLELKEQQIQRYEATDYRSASLTRL
jgi:ribosome-binding protein aMBF1 (putative translation factor)